MDIDKFMEKQFGCLPNDIQSKIMLESDGFKPPKCSKEGCTGLAKNKCPNDCKQYFCDGCKIHNLYNLCSICSSRKCIGPGCEGYGNYQCKCCKRAMCYNCLAESFRDMKEYHNMCNTCIWFDIG